MPLYRNGLKYRFDRPVPYLRNDGTFVTLGMSKMGQAEPTPVFGKIDTGFDSTILSFPTAKTLGINNPAVNAYTTRRIPTVTGEGIFCYMHVLWLYVDDVYGRILRPNFWVWFSRDVNFNLFGLDCTSYYCLVFDCENIHFLRP
jgi:hypothetical protein